jgi:hypothetical protein
VNEDLLLSIGFFALVMVLLTLWVRRRNASSWAGVVESIKEVRKTHHQDDHDPGTTEHLVRIRARSDRGQRIKLEMPLRTFEALYPDGLNAGDRVAKRPGTWYPTYEEGGAPLGT